MMRRLCYLTITLIGIALLAGWAVYLKLDRTPSELLRYTERRLIGHPKLELLALPVIHAVRAQIEMPVAMETLPTLGKGQQKTTLSPQTYEPNGRPQGKVVTDSKIDHTPSQLINSASALQQAVQQAQAGDVLEIMPGTYRIDTDLKTGAAGTASRPIMLRAAVPETVVLDISSMEGMRIAHAYWIIENLTLRGKCGEDRYCEHAFHVFGPAKNIVIRNNFLTDFNAHIKVNGLNGAWPDQGLIQYNTITNSHRRETILPVTPIDIVGANAWVIADNIISNFIKGDGNLVAYGAFMKGGGQEGRIERNLIVCTPSNISQTGLRVGLSMGGGGTGKEYCRDKRCDTEHTKGTIANNVIAHCNDFGIDVNTANQTLIAHNTLINTSGIDVRQPMASALVYGNIFEGHIRSRNGALLEQEANTTASFTSPATLVLNWRTPPDEIATHPKINDDFCGKPRAARSLPGAFGNSKECP